VPAAHYVNQAPLEPPFPAGHQLALFGMGCFWGAERKFWELPGVISTSVGYAAGFTPNPTYEEVCTGRTGHNEVVRVVFDPAKTSYETLLKAFWERACVRATTWARSTARASTCIRRSSAAWRKPRATRINSS
jgi:peptide-methionine (S)-S-oxide reductase